MIDTFIKWLREGGCPHTSYLEGGGLCGSCSNELADLLERVDSLLDLTSDYEGIL